MSEIDALVALIEEVSGLVVPERDHARLEATVRERLQATSHRNLTSYVQWLRLDRDGAEWRQVLSSITVNESYLFRAPQQLRAVDDVVLPDLVARRPITSMLRAWSAGCARGEEAVTLAIVLDLSPHMAGRPWRILATDVDEAAIRDARRARFGRRAVERVPAPLMEEYFRSVGSGFELDERLRARIDVSNLNLVRPELGLEPRSFDLIFLRNVLIYFRPESQRRVVASIARLLADDGYLFLGPSESLWQLSSDLVAVDMGDCFCYRHRAILGPGRPERAAREPEVPPLVTESAGRPPMLSAPGAGLPAEDVPASGLPIHGAAAAAGHQVRELSGAGTASASEQPPVRSVAPVVVALVEDRLADAGELIGEGLARCPEDPLLRALEGLAHELRDEIEAAVRSYRAALYLDPSLYQVRFLLARSMERLGWSQRALREYRETLSAVASPLAHEVPDWSVLGLPSRHQVEVNCLQLLAHGLNPTP